MVEEMNSHTYPYTFQMSVEMPHTVPYVYSTGVLAGYIKAMTVVPHKNSLSRPSTTGPAATQQVQDHLE